MLRTTAPDWISCEPLWHARDPQQDRRDLVATAEVHFIWRLASEGGMGNNGIVLHHIERDQFFKCRECVQLVQKQAAMLHGPPQGLDHGIRIADLDLSEDAVQLPESQKVVDLALDVPDARVGNHGGCSPQKLRTKSNRPELSRDLSGARLVVGIFPRCLSKSSRPC